MRRAGTGAPGVPGSGHRASGAFRRSGSPHNRAIATRRVYIAQYTNTHHHHTGSAHSVPIIDAVSISGSTAINRASVPFRSTFQLQFRFTVPPPPSPLTTPAFQLPPPQLFHRVHCSYHNTATIHYSTDGTPGSHHTFSSATAVTRLIDRHTDRQSIVPQ